ncbi:hypothetical protein GCM10010361_70450 [Streptomyces olivaceiscleroticus]|uniref:Uncharacterized protein n=1 Tax=Streptomyces olivaceiscleroticus TaxID=68245 RepID=A0ABP3L7R2_9ACTN
MDDDVRCVVTRQDRRKLYFEALACSPLPRDHYDEDVVTLLSGERRERALGADQYLHFTLIWPTAGFDRTALHGLNSNKDRARFNVPVALDAVQMFRHAVTSTDLATTSGKNAINTPLVGRFPEGTTDSRAGRNGGRAGDPVRARLCDLRGVRGTGTTRPGPAERRVRASPEMRGPQPLASPASSPGIQLLTAPSRNPQDHPHEPVRQPDRWPGTAARQRDGSGARPSPRRHRTRRLRHR